MFGEDHVAHPPCSSTMDPAMRGKADAPFSFSRPPPHYHQTLSFISIVVYLHVSDVSCLSGFIRVQCLVHIMKDDPNYSFIKCHKTKYASMHMTYHTFKVLQGRLFHVQRVIALPLSTFTKICLHLDD